MIEDSKGRNGRQVFPSWLVAERENRKRDAKGIQLRAVESEKNDSGKRYKKKRSFRTLNWEREGEKDKNGRQSKIIKFDDFLLHRSSSDRE